MRFNGNRKQRSEKEANISDLAGKKWLTLAEVRQVLDLGRTKTYELVARGEIPAVRIGLVLRVNREELDRWLETKRVVWNPRKGKRMNLSAG